jgi:hypothetical protein
MIRTSYDVEHISVICRGSKSQTSLALLQGFEHANRRTMYVTGQKRDANSSVLREQLKFFD